ncbi:MAG: sigma-70 family RNA polymerase sigma factor [Gemmataceae bacterium]
MTDRPAAVDGSRLELLYHFCRLQLPALNLGFDACRRHLERTFELHRGRHGEVSWDAYLDNLYPLDWFIACGCVDGNERAWEHLFAARAGRSDCLLMDALRARAGRLFPRDEERQESAVTEFWGHLYVPESAGSLPVLARYDGQRPLVPWLIRVFQNWHISQLRRHTGVQALPEDDLTSAPSGADDSRWREVFGAATHDWLSSLSEKDVLLLGLRLRYRMSQREVAGLLDVHEGTISRRTDALRDQCLEHLGQRLTAEGWSGENLFDFIRSEMHHLLLDDPRLSVDHLAQLLSQTGKKMGA